jgi:hypothetical protein
LIAPKADNYFKTNFNAEKNRSSILMPQTAAVFMGIRSGRGKYRRSAEYREKEREISNKFDKYGRIFVSLCCVLEA